MSKTFTSRPSQTYARGRGNNTNQNNVTQPSPTRGRGSGGRMAVRGGKIQSHTGNTVRPSQRMNRQNPQTEEGDEMEQGMAPSPRRTSQELGQRMSHQGAFTVISPNEKKRQTIGEQARRGLEAYEVHKEQSRLTHVNYVGTVGGGEITEQDARQRAIDNQRTNKMNRLEKQHHYQEEKRKKEQREIEQKKIQQRMKAERNAAMQSEDLAGQKNKWDKDRLKKNEEFLNRLQQSQPSSTATANRQTGSVENGALKTSSVLRGLAAPVDNFPLATNVTQSAATDHSLPTDGASAHTGVETNDDLQTLMTMFPQYEMGVLQDILNEAGDADSAMQLLLG